MGPHGLLSLLCRWTLVKHCDLPFTCWTGCLPWALGSGLQVSEQATQGPWAGGQDFPANLVPLEASLAFLSCLVWDVLLGYWEEGDRKGPCGRMMFLLQGYYRDWHLVLGPLGGTGFRRNDRVPTMGQAMASLWPPGLTSLAVPLRLPTSQGTSQVSF